MGPASQQPAFTALFLVDEETRPGQGRHCCSCLHRDVARIEWRTYHSMHAQTLSVQTLPVDAITYAPISGSTVPLTSAAKSLHPAASSCSLSHSFNRSVEAPYLLTCAPQCCPPHAAPRAAGTCLREVQWVGACGDALERAVVRKAAGAGPIHRKTKLCSLLDKKEGPLLKVGRPAANRDQVGSQKVRWHEKNRLTVEGDDHPVLAVLALHLVHGVTGAAVTAALPHIQMPRSWMPLPPACHDTAGPLSSRVPGPPPAQPDTPALWPHAIHHHAYNA